MRFWDEGSGRVSKEALTDIGTETCLDEGDFRAGNWPGRFWHYGYGYERLRFELAQNPEQDVERGARSLFAVRDLNAPQGDDGLHPVLFSGSVRVLDEDERRYLRVHGREANEGNTLGFDITPPTQPMNFERGALTSLFLQRLGQECKVGFFVFCYEEEGPHGDPRTTFLRERGFNKTILRSHRESDEGDKVAMLYKAPSPQDRPAKPR